MKAFVKNCHAYDFKYLNRGFVLMRFWIQLIIMSFN